MIWRHAAQARLGLSHSTEKHHLTNARSKDGATTTAQLAWIVAQRLQEPEGVTHVKLARERAQRARWSPRQTG